MVFIRPQGNVDAASLDADTRYAACADDILTVGRIGNAFQFAQNLIPAHFWHISIAPV